MPVPLWCPPTPSYRARLHHSGSGGCRPVRLIEYLQCGFVQMPADRFTQLLAENVSKDFQSLVELNGIDRVWNNRCRYLHAAILCVPCRTIAFVRHSFLAIGLIWYMPIALQKVELKFQVCLSIAWPKTKAPSKEADCFIRGGAVLARIIHEADDISLDL